jgi:hypothetical protein
MKKNSWQKVIFVAAGILMAGIAIWLAKPGFFTWVFVPKVLPVVTENKDPDHYNYGFSYQYPNEGEEPSEEAKQFGLSLSIDGYYDHDNKIFYTSVMCGELAVDGRESLSFLTNNGLATWHPTREQVFKAILLRVHDPKIIPRKTATDCALAQGYSPYETEWAGFDLPSCTKWVQISDKDGMDYLGISAEGGSFESFMAENSLTLKTLGNPLLVDIRALAGSANE